MSSVSLRTDGPSSSIGFHMRSMLHENLISKIGVYIIHSGDAEATDKHYSLVSRAAATHGALPIQGFIPKNYLQKGRFDPNDEVNDYYRYIEGITGSSPPKPLGLDPYNSYNMYNTAPLLGKGLYGEAVYSLRCRPEHQAILLGDLEYFKRNRSKLTDAFFSGPTLGGYEPCGVLHFAVYSGNLGMVELIMKEVPWFLIEKYGSLETPIELAVKLGHKEIALCILDYVLENPDDWLDEDDKDTIQARAFELLF